MTREDQHVFVNRRPVQNRGLNFALFEGYHTALMKGRYPVCCLFLEIDPAAVDVNIHPAKREVRFHQEGEVRRLVAQAVRETLLRLAHSPQSTVHGARSKEPSPQPAVQSSRTRRAGGTVEEAAQASLPSFPPGCGRRWTRPRRNTVRQPVFGWDSARRRLRLAELRPPPRTPALLRLRRRLRLGRRRRRPCRC